MNKKRLDSWKGIAAFLGRSLRTVQRWHDCNGLPVHHYGGHKGSVFAYEEEINHWLAGLAQESGTPQARVDETQVSGRRSSNELTTTANSMWETRSERNIQAIADLYRKAIADDPGNSAAYAGLANAMVFCALNDIIDGTMAYPSAVESLRRMPQIDSEYLDAKCPAAWIDLLYNRNWRLARASFEDILSKRPSSFALAGLAAMYVAEGRILKAQECAWEAWRLNPLVNSLGAFLCWCVYLSGDFQQVLDLVSQIRSGGGDGGLVTCVEALVLIQSDSVAEYIGRLEATSLRRGASRIAQLPSPWVGSQSYSTMPLSLVRSRLLAFASSAECSIGMELQVTGKPFDGHCIISGQIILLFQLGSKPPCLCWQA